MWLSISENIPVPRRKSVWMHVWGIGGGGGARISTISSSKHHYAPPPPNKPTITPPYITEPLLCAGGTRRSKTKSFQEAHSLARYMKSALFQALNCQMLSLLENGSVSFSESHWKSKRPSSEMIWLKTLVTVTMPLCHCFRKDTVFNTATVDSAYLLN